VIEARAAGSDRVRDGPNHLVLPDDPLPELVLEVEQLVALDLGKRRDGMPVLRATMPAMSPAPTSSGCAGPARAVSSATIAVRQEIHRVRSTCAAP
jgi:hypothetical protein